MPVVDRPRLECEFLAEQVEEVCQRVDGGGDGVSFDPRDSGLGGASPVSQLLLRQPVAAPLAGGTWPEVMQESISDLTYEAATLVYSTHDNTGPSSSGQRTWPLWTPLSRVDVSPKLTGATHCARARRILQEEREHEIEQMYAAGYGKHPQEDGLATRLCRPRRVRRGRGRRAALNRGGV